jgi:hypothetical protein
MPCSQFPIRLSLVHGFGSRQSCELSRDSEREFERTSPELRRDCSETGARLGAHIWA